MGLSLILLGQISSPVTAGSVANKQIKLKARITFGTGARPLMQRTFRAALVVAPNTPERYRKIAADIKFAAFGEPAPPAPPSDLEATASDLQRRARNLGVEAVAFLLSPLPIRFSRSQLEYLSERTFEAATGQNLRLYEDRW